jgi:Kef-type K+ transport system membrane component KefB
MSRLRNYWTYSVGLAVVWALILSLSAALGSRSHLRTVELLFAGFAISWVSTTIARYVYPPPSKWTRAPRTEIS